MKNLIIFKKITNENLELACKIQNEIFPEEDARKNFIEQINNDPYRKDIQLLDYIQTNLLKMLIDYMNLED